MKQSSVNALSECHHLPRLDPKFYKEFAVVQWTITVEDRATGWLDERFHLCFRELMLHAAARESLLCPIYILMPDHLHLLWMGLRPESDQRRAMKFLRTYVALEMSRRSTKGKIFHLQKQAHDWVLMEKDRQQRAFEKSLMYLLNNPCRKNLVKHPQDWKYLGAIVPGYPTLHPIQDDFWNKFWRLYGDLRGEPDS